MSHDHHDHTHHDHSHAHRHHVHVPHGARRSNILFAAILNLGFTVIELIGGLLTNSVAVLSDALHDLGDSFALFGAYIAEGHALKGGDSKRTFGYARLSLLSALLSAVILLVGSVYIFIEAITRVFNPEPVASLWVAGLAVFGMITNYVAYRRMHGGDSANEKVLSWHLLEDVLGWVAVLLGALIMHFTQWYVIDPLLTLGFTAFIVWGVVRNLREVINLFMEGVPAQINLNQLKDALQSIDGVQSIHDVHVWSLDGAEAMFTGHVVLEAGQISLQTEIYTKIKQVLTSYKIGHTTIEFEVDGKGECHGDRCD